MKKNDKRPVSLEQNCSNIIPPAHFSLSECIYNCETKSCLHSSKLAARRDFFLFGLHDPNWGIQHNSCSHRVKVNVNNELMIECWLFSPECILLDITDMLELHTFATSESP